MAQTLLHAVAVIVLLGVLIFVHELGHFLVAKALNVKVLRFSLGFGPPFLSFRRGETEYWLAYIPLGGYVKMAGDDPRAEVAEEDRGRGFLEQAPWRRLLIAVAGPVMNLLLPFLLIAGILASALGSKVIGNTVGTVIPGSAAAEAGLRPGDRILAVTGPEGDRRPIRDFEDVQDAITPHAGQTVVMELVRDGQVLPPMSVQVQRDRQSNGIETVERGVIGFMPYFTPARIGPVVPGSAGPLEPFDLVVSVGGKPVGNAMALQQAVAAAGCAPIDLEVLRERPRPLPGAVLADYTREVLHAVPTCLAGSPGRPTFRIVDPWVSATVAAVEPNGPAARAGLRRGDTVTAVNGKAVYTFAQLATTVNRELAGGKAGTLTLADGRSVNLAAEEVVTKNRISGRDEHSWNIGLLPPRQKLDELEVLTVPGVSQQRSPGEIVVKAARLTAEQIRSMVIGLAKMFTHDVDPQQMGSIIQVAVVVGEAVEQGLSQYFAIFALISVNLGIMNLLPIPVLDGGHIAQALVETVTRRPLSVRMREIANVVGLVLLISLMLFAFRNDIVRLLDKGKPVAEETAR